MLTISNVPLSVYNRALELYNEPSEDTIEQARVALGSLEKGKEFNPEWPGIDAFAQALAEHMCSGEIYVIKSAP